MPLTPLKCQECGHEYYRSQCETTLHPDLFCSDDCETNFARLIADHHGFYFTEEDPDDLGI